MPQIFELFGYELSNTSQDAQRHRQETRCPFMGTDCDGGGNRYLSRINLANLPNLQANYPNRLTIPAGVCSIQMRDPWIVCPRRLLSFNSQYHYNVLKRLYEFLNYRSGTKLGVWPEVKVVNKSNGKRFNYTFDYVIAPVKCVDIHQTGVSQDVFVNAGYRVKNGCVEDFVDLQTQAGQQGKAIAGLAIIEIMTTSTSGGNKQAQSSINQACAQALAGQNHQAPSINKRQVIGRMLSQFFAKSAVAKQWGGHAVWVIQEPLANYISSSTALNISTGNQAFRSNLNDVNMAIVSYDSSQQNQTPKQLALSRFVTGQLLTYNPTAFENILLAPFCPNIVILIEALAKQKPKIVPVP